MSATKLTDSPVDERINGTSFRHFASLPPQDQLAMLSQWAAHAAQLLEASTLPIRWKGKALALKVTQWARAVGVTL